MLAHHQIFVAEPHDADDVRLQDDGESERHHQHTGQHVGRQCEQLFTERQAGRIADDAMNGAQVADITSGSQTLKIKHIRKPNYTFLRRQFSTHTKTNTYTVMAKSNS